MNSKTRFEKIGPGLFRKVTEGIDDQGKPFRKEGGVILARVRDKGRSTYKSTESNNATDARRWVVKFKRDARLERNGIESKGVTATRAQPGVAAIIDD